jgi:hypothetical protein
VSDIIGRDIAVDEHHEPDWMMIAQRIYTDSTDYLNSSIRPKWTTALAIVNNTHPPGSRFYEDTNKHRSRLFRPKIKPAVRRHLAALAMAMFTNNEVVDIAPADESDKEAGAAARLLQNVLQNRLTEDLDWFLTSLGAYQDTLVYSVCISKQYWAKTSDTPVLELIKPENFRFDPNADWRNPAKTSPYLIEIIPMYAGAVLEAIDNSKDWRQYTLAQILSSNNESLNDITRQGREGLQRQDPATVTNGNEFSIVSVHFNVYRNNGQDYGFYTLGTSLLLSDPKPLHELFAHGRDLYCVGFSSIESHKNYPQSLVDDGADLQEEVNSLVNSRMDNIRLVLNKRFIVRRKGNVDLAALMRNVPGGGVMADDPQQDVKWMETPDITSSAYAEQDRLNVEFDDVLAVTSPSTVNANRNLKETVGGMNLMAAGVSADQELMIRTFIVTWVDRVLKIILKLCQNYETDVNKLSHAAKKAGIDNFHEAPPQNQDELLLKNVHLTVNVGMGNTNPEQKIKRLMLAINTTAQMPSAAEMVDWAEVIKEVYSNAGFGDGSRFMKDENAPPPQAPPDPKAQVEQAKLEILKQKMEFDQHIQEMKLQVETQILQMKTQHEKEMLEIKLNAERQLRSAEMQAQFGLEQGKLQTERDKTALTVQNSMNEMRLKREMGSGI